MVYEKKIINSPRKMFNNAQLPHASVPNEWVELSRFLTLDWCVVLTNPMPLFLLFPGIIKEKHAFISQAKRWLIFWVTRNRVQWVFAHVKSQLIIRCYIIRVECFDWILSRHEDRQFKEGRFLEASWRCQRDWNGYKQLLFYPVTNSVTNEWPVCKWINYLKDSTTNYQAQGVSQETPITTITNVTH